MRIGTPAQSESIAANGVIDVEMPLAEAAARGYRIVDIREPWECLADPLPVPGHEAVPMGRLLAGEFAIAEGERYLFVCAHGVRSRAAAEAFRAIGRENVWSLRGGLAADG